MYRKFYFINGNGNRFNLTEKNSKRFMSQPSGLGFSNTITTLRFGNSEKTTSRTYDMPTIGGEILFYDKVDNAYQDYLDFVDFIRITPIKFYYLPPNKLDPYYIDCEVLSVQKSEYERDGALHCPITIYGTSLWQNSVETSRTFQNDAVGEGKHYDLEREYAYHNTTLSDMPLNVSGGLPVGFIIEINGEVTNPQLSFRQNGIDYGKIKITGTYDEVMIDSDDANEEIYLKRNGSVIANPTSYQDLSIADGVAEITFVKLRVGQTTASFTCDNILTFGGSVTFKWKDKMVSI